MIVAFEEELFHDFKKSKDIIDEKDLPEFFAWNYWPMSVKVLSDLEFFKKIGFIDAKMINSLDTDGWEEMSSLISDIQLEKNTEIEYVEEEYSLSITWVNYVEYALYPHLTEVQKDILIKLKKQFNAAPLRVILDYIYNNSKYAKYVQKDMSKIYDQYVKSN